MPVARAATSFAYFCALLTAFSIGGCGGGGAGSGQVDSGGGSVASLTPLSAIVAEPAGAHCSLAGNAVLAGLDANHNNTLDSSEVSSTQYVCNLVNTTPGASGMGGRGVIVTLTTEPAGANCASGGTKISTGIDTNGNEALDEREITSSGYVCGGTVPSGTMMITGMEQPGSNCAYGGSIVATGRDTNNNNVISGSEIASLGYACDSAPTSGITWTDVSVPTAMLAGMGYLADNPARVVFTLPTTPTIGDMFRVTSVDSGGWEIDQQAGQTILMSRLDAPTWQPHETNRFWRGVASSADGSRLVAVVNGDNIYTSTDSGQTWTPQASSQQWWAVASSADGMKLVAVVFGGQIYTSADGGATWAAHESSRTWSAIASSNDGTRLVAVVYGGGIYTSVDSGATWTARATTRSWVGVASSADGMSLAATAYNGQIYTSVDAGVTWTARDAVRNWFGIASSSDGTKLIAAEQNGLLYTSANAGVSWTARNASRNWSGLSASADGTHMVAADMSGLLYTSTDAGVTWQARESSRAWNAVTASADGVKIVAVDYGGMIYTSSAMTTTGAAGFLRGELYETVELQYLGSGNFEVVRFAGDLTLN